MSRRTSFDALGAALVVSAEGMIFSAFEAAFFVENPFASQAASRREVGITQRVENRTSHKD